MKIKPFKCIKQLILQSAIMCCCLSLTAYLIHEYVLLKNTFLGGFESQNQTNSAIKL